MTSFTQPFRSPLLLFVHAGMYSAALTRLIRQSMLLIPGVKMGRCYAAHTTQHDSSEPERNVRHLAAARKTSEGSM